MEMNFCSAIDWVCASVGNEDSNMKKENGPVVLIGFSLKDCHVIIHGLGWIVGLK